MIMGISEMNLFAQTYDQLWKQVERASVDDLPRQVISTSEKIIAKARKEDNFGQLMRAWVTIVDTKTSIDADSFDVASFPEIRPQNAVESAIYNAIMAEVYNTMSDSYTIRYDEEAQTKYADEELRHIRLALSDKELLGHTSVDSYEPLVSRGEDSRLYDHDLLSLLTRFVMEHCSQLANHDRIDIYSDVAQYYKQAGRMEAYTLVQLVYLGQCMHHGFGDQRMEGDEYIEALRQLLKESENLESGADVARELLNNVTSTEERLSLARWAQLQFKGSVHIPYFSNIEQDIMRPSCNIVANSEHDFVPGMPVKVKMDYRNFADMTLEVRKFNGYDNNEGLKTDGSLIETRTYELGTDSMNMAHRAKNLPTSGSLTDSITLDAGKYVFVAKNAGVTGAAVIDITSLQLFYYHVPHNELAVVVLNKCSGRPVEGATVRCSRLSAGGENPETYTTGRDGMVTINLSSRITQLHAFMPGTDDETKSISNINPNRRYGRDTRGDIHTEIFTDRAIYRPGQTVHVAGITYNQSGDETNAVEGEEVMVSLRDANYETIAELKAVTDEWGTWNVDFELPAGRLPGAYSIRTQHASTNIQVEEYKRPTFTVETQQAANEGAERQYSFGDSLDVEAVAKTYSGVPLQGAKVTYKVECAEVHWRTWYGANWVEIDEGETTTDEDGKAHAGFLLTDSLLLRSDGILRYRVTFDVTSAAGETHSEVFTTAISKRGFGLSVDMPQWVDMVHPTELTVKAVNAQNRPVEVSGYYYVVKSGRNPVGYSNYEENGDYYIGGVQFSDDELMVEGRFESGKPITLPSLGAGYYMVYVKSRDAKGNDITAQFHFAAYNSSKATPLAGTKKGEPTHFSDAFLHFEENRFTFSETQPARLFFSPSEEDIYLTYILVNDSAVFERRSVVVGRDLRQLTINYRTEYGDGINVMMYYVKEGRTYSEIHAIKREEPDKRLMLSWHTFRDKLRPGQEEEWVLTVTDPEGRAVNGAQLMATLYDASLDALVRHSWQMYIHYNHYVASNNVYASPDLLGKSIWLSVASRMQTAKDRQWDRLTTYVGAMYGPRVLEGPFMKSNRVLSRAAVASGEIMELAAEPLMMQAAVATDMNSEDAIAEEEEATERDAKSPKAQLRTNFAETALFMPRVATDEQGRAHIRFTLPESLTEWHFLGLAHTSSMDFGTIEASAVARKDFMVQPNMPRFVREGDHATIASLVINRTDKQQDACVSIRLLDAESMSELYADSKSVSIAPDQTTSVSFDFVADDRCPMLVCEITAESETFSDGERQYLPVLSAKRYMTETIPFYMARGEEHKDLDLRILFNNNSATATHRRMVLEYTQRPVWTVIEALEAVKAPECDDAVSLAAALYSNVTAARLAAEIDGLEEALTNETHHATSDIDAADDDLRDIIQQEAPWMRDARQEAEQRAAIADFFNPALIKSRTDNARERLLELQLTDGSWSWFEGMDGSYYITLSVCEMLALLNSDDTHEQLLQGMEFLDKVELERYNEMKRKKTIYPAESTMHYLYVCSLIPGRKVASGVTAMQGAYLKVIAKSSRSLTIYGKANSACILRVFGKAKAADKMLQSAIEYSITRPDMGRYYVTDKASYSWRDYRLPTHLAAMRAISQSSRTDRHELLNDMKLWLLRQKQVQMWDNPMNTIAAVDFLKDEVGGEDEGVTAVFAIDGKAVDVEVDTALFLSRQLGYVKTVMPEGNTLSVARGKVQDADSDAVIPDADAAMNAGAAMKAGDGVSFGAVYAQYLENIESVHQQSAGQLTISRKLYKDGQEIDPDTAALHVGDKVTIRIIITSDRDIDFLQVRSGHAACLEPTTQLSGYRWMNGRGGYVSMHDASTDIFFDRFTRGTSTYDITYHVTRTGQYLSDIATVQCAYSPEFSAHAEAIRMTVK